MIRERRTVSTDSSPFRLNSVWAFGFVFVIEKAASIESSYTSPFDKKRKIRV